MDYLCYVRVLACQIISFTKVACLLEADKDKFLYFGYGSNMLTKRIHINNPTAVHKGVGLLLNYRLDFNYWSKRWGGAAATIVPDSKHHVWGAIWEIDNSNMKDLDRQEGVDHSIYEVVPVNVITPQDETVSCRCYQLVVQPEDLEEGEELPKTRRPSKVYLDTIIRGAQESGLPNDYIRRLSAIKHNGYDGPVNYKTEH